MRTRALDIVAPVQDGKMVSREEMVAALKHVVVPALRQRGFTGSFPHFRRIAAQRVDLLTIQFDKWGGGFVVELAKSGADGFTTALGVKIPAARLKAHDLHPKDRLRLGAAQQGQDFWFRYDQKAPVDAVARDVAAQLERAETWWNGG
jgi:antitoxin component of MazEF toxin-antitoxin module